jgi:peptide deformylase
MKLVPSDEIPKDIQETPLNDPMKIYQIFMKMEEICTSLGGVGLSAVQVGIPWKMFIKLSPLDKSELHRMYDWYVNCEYEPIDWNANVAKTKSLEGCLSLKRDGKLRRFFVERFPTVRVKGKRFIADGPKPEFEDVEFEPELLVDAVIFQHEIDHHNGILISDIGNETDIYQVIVNSKLI